MKMSVLVASALLLGAMVTPSLAFEAITPPGPHSPVTKASCDTHKDDQQAQCAADCEDKYIRARQFNMSDFSKVDAEKKACDTKCGCPQNSQ
ncbi:MAG TPA: hypothetical protein VEH76_11285 [Methylocystis sp.]|nr:hypothetical protein [Methylocystis sp.]